MNFLKSLLVAASLLTTTWAAVAQDYPSRSIKVVVPFPAGGGGDFHGRLLAQKLGDLLGQPVVVDNRAGANGNIGADHVAKSAPDGYTIFLGGANVSMAPSIYAKLSYDIRKDLTPVSLFSRMQNILLVPQNSPFKTVSGLIAEAKANPGKLNYASSGLGGSPHLTMELLRSLTGTDITHVIYKGDAPAFTAMMGNEIEMYFASIPGVIPMVRSGKLRPLAVSASKRSPTFPEVPTMEEAGVKGFDVGSWWGIFVPAGTPAPIVRKLNEAIAKIVRDPDVRERLLAVGSEAASSTPEEFRKIVLSDVDKYAAIAKAAKLEPQ